MTIESGSENQLIMVATDERVAIITLNNPPAHVLSQTMTDELIRAFEDLRRLDLAAVIITGRGSHFFCAGADIRELVQNSPLENRAYFSRLYCALNLVSTCRFPVIAAVNGYAFGAGLDLALCADIRVMDRNTQMCGTGVNLNLVFCTQRLARLVGSGRAKDMLLRARRMGAEEALQIGLVEHVAEPGEAVREAEVIARQISSKGQAAVRRVKQVIDAGLELPLEDALNLEAEAIYEMFASSEFKRRAQAFLAR